METQVLETRDLNPSQWHALCGGSKRMNGELGGAIDFGFVKSDPALLSSTHPDGTRIFQAVDPNEDIPSVKGDIVVLWQWMRAAAARLPETVAPLFRGLPAYSWQFTGSCVNSGGFNALVTRAFIECAQLLSAESPLLPMTLIAYGQSRYDAFRDSSEGEGSSGDAMAKALASIGAPPIGSPGCPVPVFCGPAMCFDRRTELQYSSINGQPAGLRELSKPHKITYGVVTSADEAEAELRRLRPLTWAGDWGGTDKGTVDSNGLLMMPRRETWNHQESCLGFGYFNGKRKFRIQNNWFMASQNMKASYVRTRDGMMIDKVITPGEALPMHGDNPDAGLNGPPGGFWIDDADMEYQCRNGEVRSIRSFLGYSGPIDLGRI